MIEAKEGSKRMKIIALAWNLEKITITTTTMEKPKVKREEYLKRLDELREKERTATDAGELKKIAGQIRYVERKIYQSGFPPERKDYTVKIKLVFEGEVTVYTTSKKEALESVKNNFGAVIGNVQTSSPEIINWDIPVHPQKIVK